MARLPSPGSDDNVWGTILNDFLAQVHNTDGTLKDGVIATAKLDSTVQSKLATVDNLTLIATTTVSGTAYTLALADANKIVETTGASAVTITVPPDSGVAFSVGTLIELFQYGTGALNVTGGIGVTLRSADGLHSARTQFSSLSLRKRAANEWVLAGDLA
jgi:hypothetical protein